jgi:hypothetical protein
VQSALVVRMSPSVYGRAAHGCVRLISTREGTLLTCIERKTDSVRLRTRDGRTIRFRSVVQDPTMEWTRAAQSPDGRWLLLAASLPCDSDGAFVAASAGGTLRWAPSLLQGCDNPEGLALGWTRDNRAVVAFRPFITCHCRAREGVYTVDPSSRRARLLWRGDIQPILQRSR